jgi:hypothetical protein
MPAYAAADGTGMAVRAAANRSASGTFQHLGQAGSTTWAGAITDSQWQMFSNCRIETEVAELLLQCCV